MPEILQAQFQDAAKPFFLVVRDKIVDIFLGRNFLAEEIYVTEMERERESCEMRDSALGREFALTPRGFWAEPFSGGLRSLV